MLFMSDGSVLDGTPSGLSKAVFANRCCQHNSKYVEHDDVLFKRTYVYMVAKVGTGRGTEISVGYGFAVDPDEPKMVKYL